MTRILPVALVLVLSPLLAMADEREPAKVSPAAIQRHVAELDSDDAKVRSAAEAALLEAGLPAAEPAGAAALTGSAEQRFRAIRVLGKLVRSDDEATVAAAAKALCAVAAGDDAPSAGRAKEELSYFDRLETMRGLAAAFEVWDTQKDPKGARVALIPQPLLRFQDRQRENLDGTLWGYGDRGRPQAVLATFPFPVRGSEELDWWSDAVSLAAGPIRVSQVDGASPITWAPKSSGEEFQPLPDAPPPAADAKERLAQMHGLAQRLEGRQNSQPGDRPYDLMLWPKLLHRYSDPEAQIIDGGLFAFVHDSNPEIILLIEAQGKPEAATWKFALGRHTAAPLHVDLDGKEVWGGEVPPDFMSGRNPYWVLKRKVAK